MFSADQTIHILPIFQRTRKKKRLERSERESEARESGGEEAHSLPRQASRFTLASSSLAILSARWWNENREKIEGCEQSITFGYLFECFKALFSPQFSLSSWSWQIYSSYTAWNKLKLQSTVNMTATLGTIIITGLRNCARNCFHALLNDLDWGCSFWVSVINSGVFRIVECPQGKRWLYLTRLGAFF